MYNPKDIGLCSSTLAQTDFRGVAEAASKAGFASITMLPTIFNMALSSGLSEQDMRTILNDNGLFITEMDPYQAWLPTRLPTAAMAAYFYEFSEDDFYHIADTLGAKSLNLIQASPDFIETDEIVEALIGVSERAATRGLKVSVEFMPWSPVNNLESALKLIELADQSNCGVNIDTWHHFRSGGTIEQLRALKPEQVTALQFNDICETAWDDVQGETSMARMLPGTGANNSVEVIKALYEAGVNAPLNVEVFNGELVSMDANTAAQQMADAMRKVLAEATQ